MAHRAKWMYAIAGSGVVLGLFNYFQPERVTVKNAWSSTFESSAKWDYNWDGRDFSSRAKRSSNENYASENEHKSKIKEVPTARRHVFLIRHGQYNLKGKTDADRILTELGRKQADLVGKRLKSLNFNYTRLIRSTMTRAIETSDIVHKYFPDLLKESCDLIQEGAPIAPDPPSGWKIEENQYLKDGARIEKAFRKHFHRADVNQTTDSYEIMVCHANVIRYFVCRLLQFPPQAWLRFQLHHCSITWVVIQPSGRVGVYAIGDSGYFSPEEMTG